MLFKNAKKFMRLHEAITSNGQPLISPDDDPNNPPEDDVPDFSEDLDTGNDQQQGDNGSNGETDPNAVDNGDATADGEGGDPNAEGGPGEGGENPEAGGEDMMGEEQPPGADDEAKNLETQLFSKLTPQQIAAKNKELKTQFVNLYETINTSIDRLAKAQRKEYTIKALNFVVKKLLDIKELVKDYVIDQFDTKSYVENQINLQRNMAIYLTLTKILEELNKASIDMEQKEDLITNKIKKPFSIRKRKIRTMMNDGLQPQDVDEG